MGTASVTDIAHRDATDRSGRAPLRGQAGLRADRRSRVATPAGSAFPRRTRSGMRNRLTESPLRGQRPIGTGFPFHRPTANAAGRHLTRASLATRDRRLNHGGFTGPGAGGGHEPCRFSSWWRICIVAGTGAEASRRTFRMTRQAATPPWRPGTGRSASSVGFQTQSKPSRPVPGTARVRRMPPWPPSLRRGGDPPPDFPRLAEAEGRTTCHRADGSGDDPCTCGIYKRELFSLASRSPTASQIASPRVPVSQLP